MLRLPAVLIFVVLTFVCWGAYGPVLHLGQDAMGGSRWRPFICVGVAYFFIAVVVPMLLLQGSKETGRWTMSGMIWSIIAGSVGAIGALGIILAFEFGGKPVYIMPIVFGCAPVVNTFVTMWMNRTYGQASVPFYIAVLLVALGAAGVFVFKPKLETKAAGPEQTEVDSLQSEEVDSADTGNELKTLRAGESDESDESVSSESEADGKSAVVKQGWFAGIKAFLAIALTALCWGAYGPLLHKGQFKMHGSRLRPFVCVGLAYFVIAVVVPGVVLLGEPDGASFTLIGSFWSMLAGAAGAIGALGIILAFNFGGRPVFVMPLVFGGAPIVNTIISMSQSYMASGEFGQITSWFLGSLCLVIVGAVCVLLFAPKPHLPPKTEGAPDKPKSTPVDKPSGVAKTKEPVKEASDDKPQVSGAESKAADDQKKADGGADSSDPAGSQ